MDHGTHWGVSSNAIAIIEELLEAHPRLTQEAVRGALAFAAEALRADIVYPLTRNTS
jgi:uncharacterized protein (DUF433 family)